MGERRGNTAVAGWVDKAAVGKAGSRGPRRVGAWRGEITAVDMAGGEVDLKSLVGERMLVAQEEGRGRTLKKRCDSPDLPFQDTREKQERGLCELDEREKGRRRDEDFNVHKASTGEGSWGELGRPKGSRY